jgi:hypothetical protein
MLSGRLLFGVRSRYLPNLHRPNHARYCKNSDLTEPPTKEKLLKGGDPATPSGTATLLRLHPPHRALLRRLRPSRVRPATSGAPDSGDVTGGECKARERIQRCVLTSVY